MGDLGFRLLFVGGVAMSAVIAGSVWRRGAALIRHSVGTPTLDNGVYLFTAQGCSSCGRVRDVLAALGVGFIEFAYESDSSTFGAFGVDRVPAMLMVGEKRSWMAFGVPSATRLRRWLAQDP